MENLAGGNPLDVSKAAEAGEGFYDGRGTAGRGTLAANPRGSGLRRTVMADG